MKVYQGGHHGSYNGTDVGASGNHDLDKAVISCAPWTFDRRTIYPFTTFPYGHPRWCSIDQLEGYLFNSLSELVYPPQEHQVQVLITAN